jgi:hypothetical protein
MRARAEVRFRYGSKRKAEMVARLLEVDNQAAPRSLRISTLAMGDTVVTGFEHSRLGTFLAALDDLLFTEKLITGVLSLTGEENAGHSPDTE